MLSRKKPYAKTPEFLFIHGTDTEIHLRVIVRVGANYARPGGAQRGSRRAGRLWFLIAVQTDTFIRAYFTTEASSCTSTYITP